MPFTASCFSEMASWLRLAQFRRHPLDKPVQRGLVRFFLEMHNRWQHPQQDAGLIAGQGEVPTDNKANCAAVGRADASIL
jgi:hypothetical protein